MDYIKNRFSGFKLYASIELFYWLGYSATTFFSAYLACKGFDVKLVGFVMAIVNLLGVFSAPLFGNISDKTGSPRKVFMMCCLAVGIIAFLIPFGVRATVLSISLVVPLYFLWGIFCKPMTGLCDSWFLGVIDRGASFSFGTIRYVGSIGYAVMCMLYSFAANITGNQDVIFFLYAFLSSVTLLLCIYAGSVDKDGTPIKKDGKEKNVGILGAIKNYHLDVYLVCHCLMNLPMYCSLTFIPYKLIEITGATGSLGYVTALRSLAEIPSLIFGIILIKKIGIRSSISSVMICFAAVQILFITASNVPVLILAMVIMGFVNGGMMAFQMQYIRKITPMETLASAVTMCTAMALISAMAGNAIGGILVSNFGTIAYFLFAFACEIIALLIFIFSVPLGKVFGKNLPDLSDSNS